MKTLTLFAILALLFVANSFTYAGHAMSGDASKQVSAGIRAELVAAIAANKITNQVWAQAFLADLNEPDYKKHKVGQIDAQTATQIFDIFGLKDPKCDSKSTGTVKDAELKCLGKIWKYYVPKV